MKTVFVFAVIIVLVLLNADGGDGTPLFFRLMRNIFRKGNKKPSSYKVPPKSPSSSYNKPPPAVPSATYKPPPNVEPTTTPQNPSYLPPTSTPPSRPPKPSYYAPPPPLPPQPVSPLPTPPPSVRPPTPPPAPVPSMRPPPPPIIAPPPPPQPGPPAPPPQLFPPIDDNYFDNVQTELITPNEGEKTNVVCSVQRFMYLRHNY